MTEGTALPYSEKTERRKEMKEKELAKEAIEAMNNAYVPYSGYKVGAALLTKSGKLYKGCNIENASYTPTVCAERVAIFKAVSEGETEFDRIAVAGGKDGKISGIFPPCGVCRQVMAEFCPPEFPVILVTGEDSYETHSLSELLPFSFTPDNLTK